MPEIELWLWNKRLLPFTLDVKYIAFSAHLSRACKFYYLRSWWFSCSFFSNFSTKTTLLFRGASWSCTVAIGYWGPSQGREMSHRVSDGRAAATRGFELSNVCEKSNQTCCRRPSKSSQQPVSLLCVHHRNNSVTWDSLLKDTGVLTK